MAEIRPFRGVRYDAAARGRDLGDYLSPPFDTISAEEQSELLRRSPHNIVRLELASRNGGGADRYAQVAEINRSWMASGVFTQDPQPSMYVAEEEFTYNGTRQVRRGVIAAVRLEEYDRGVIFPHEGVRDEWVEDRVRMMQATRHVMSPLLVVYQDDIRHSVGGVIKAVAGGEPTEVATMAGGHTLKMWKLVDRGTQEVLAGLMRDLPLFIADGHHRYEAAMRYRSAFRATGEIDPDHAVNFRMMHLVSIDEPGLITRPFHRVLRGTSVRERESILMALGPHFTMTPGDCTDLHQLADLVAQSDCDGVVFGVVNLSSGEKRPHGRNARGLIAEFDGARLAKLVAGSGRDATPDGTDGTDGTGAALTAVTPSALEMSDYTVLHRYVLAPAFDLAGPSRPSDPDRLRRLQERFDSVTSYEHDIGRIESDLAAGDADVAFIMRPVPMQDFIEIVSRGDRLPPKATNFYPKPPAGSVLQPLDGHVGWADDAS